MKRLSLALLFSLLIGAASAQLAGGLMFPGPGTPAVSSGMVTPVLAMNSSVNIGPSNTAPSTAPFIAGPDGVFWGTTFVPIPISGTISNLIVSFPNGVGTGTYAIALLKNGTAGTLTCTISSGTTCTDSTHSVSVVPGDTLGWSVTPSGTPTAATVIQIGAVLTSVNPNEGFLLAINANNGNSNTVANYQSFGGASNPSATEAVVSFVIPTGGTIDQLNILSSGAAGAGQSYTMTVFKNGLATGLTCAVSGAVATTCVDSTHSVALVAGDLISLQSQPSASPASQTITGGVRWVPTIAGEVIVGAVDKNNLPPTSGTASLDVNGSSNPFGAESSVCSIAPLSFTVKKLIASISPVPGGVTTRTFNFREGTCAGGQANVGTPGSVACTIGSASTSCQDTTNTYSATAGQFLTVQTSTTGTNAALTVVRNSAVLTVP